MWRRGAVRINICDDAGMTLSDNHRILNDKGFLFSCRVREQCPVFATVGPPEQAFVWSLHDFRFYHCLSTPQLQEQSERGLLLHGKSYALPACTEIAFSTEDKCVKCQVFLRILPNLRRVSEYCLGARIFAFQNGFPYVYSRRRGFSRALGVVK